MTEETEAEIRELYIPFVYSYRKLAQQFGVHADTVQKIIRRKIWKHV